MDDNKNLNKTRSKSNSELRKIFFKTGGTIESNSNDNVKKYTKRSKLSHNK